MIPSLHLLVPEEAPSFRRIGHAIASNENLYARSFGFDRVDGGCNFRRNGSLGFESTPPLWGLGPPAEGPGEI